MKFQDKIDLNTFEHIWNDFLNGKDFKSDSYDYYILKYILSKEKEGNSPPESHPLNPFYQKAENENY